MPVPWAPVIGLLGLNNDADQVETILRLADIDAGSLTEGERYSHKTRIRAYRERAHRHMLALEVPDQQHISELIIREMCRQDGEMETRVSEVLKNHGWSYQDGSLVPSEEEATELDDLLPILRRKAFDRDIDAAVASADSAEPLSLLIIDLDHFKDVNDRHGHPVGDEVLVEIASVVDRRCRHKGISYRYGGEEIACLLPNFASGEALALAESIRAEVEKSSVGSKKISVTLSIGVATLPEHAQSRKDLVEAADSALYAAKHLGRNLVRISGEPTEVEPVRTIKRREPEPRSGLDYDLIRALYFTGREVRCPNDGVPLRIRENHVLARVTPDLLVSCPMCGLNATIRGEK